jgi:putative ABC transport system permease protein
VIGPAFQIASRQIGRNPSRSALTTLGVLIGVAAVIAMVSLGRGATERVQGELSGLGQNLLFVTPGSQRAGMMAGGVRPFALEDARAITREIPGVAGVAPAASRGTVVSHGGERHSTMVTGTEVSYLTVMSWKVTEGRPFTEGEERAGAAVCILGDRVRRELFGSGSPTGEMVQVGGMACRVIATLSPKGQSMFGQDQDDFVLVPLTTFQRRISGTDDVGVLFVSAASTASSHQVKRDLEALFQERRHIREGDEPDFHVHDMKEIEAMVGTITSVLTALLAAIAGVSLVVGGIGIMNIMLVAVTERTREIGIRLAIGARRRDILTQFLVEAAVLSTFGGVLGILIGVGASALVTRKLGIPLVVDPAAIAIAFLVSAGVGIVFGFAPARRASRLQPIDALRHE